MSFIQKHSVALTTDASGDATGFTGVVRGRLLRVEYERPGASPFAVGVDFTITTDRDGQALLTVANVAASTVWHPRQPTHDVAGAASLYAAAGEPVESDIPIAADRIKVVVAEGGDTLLGTLHFWIE